MNDTTERACIQWGGHEGRRHWICSPGMALKRKPAQEVRGEGEPSLSACRNLMTSNGGFRGTRSIHSCLYRGMITLAPTPNIFLLFQVHPPGNILCSRGGISIETQLARRAPPPHSDAQAKQVLALQLGGPLWVLLHRGA